MTHGLATRRVAARVAAPPKGTLDALAQRRHRRLSRLCRHPAIDADRRGHPPQQLHHPRRGPRWLQPAPTTRPTSRTRAHGARHLEHLVSDRPEVVVPGPGDVAGRSRGRISIADVALALFLSVILAAQVGGRQSGVIAAVVAASSLDFYAPGRCRRSGRARRRDPRARSPRHRRHRRRRGLRGWTNVPIIILSVRESEADKVASSSPPPPTPAGSPPNPVWATGSRHDKPHRQDWRPRVTILSRRYLRRPASGSTIRSRRRTPQPTESDVAGHPAAPAMAMRRS